MEINQMALGAGSYNSPEIRVIEVFSEGVLCESEVNSGLSVDPWEDGDFSWS